MKIEPKTKRSYGKRKPISVPELLAVRVEMTSEEATETKHNPNEVVVDVIVARTDDTTELITAESAEYDVAGLPEISVYEDVQEIDWIENTAQSQIKVKKFAQKRVFLALVHIKTNFRWKAMTLGNWKLQRYLTSTQQLTMSSSPNTATLYYRTTSPQ